MLAGAHLEDTTIDESVVFPEATISGGELRRSLVDTETHIESLRLSGAVIGAHTRLNGNRS